MDEIKKEQQDLFKSAIARLKTAGVDTTCYKDVVTALETEIRHYRNVIDHLNGRLPDDPRSADAESCTNMFRYIRMGRSQMAASIIEHSLEAATDSLDISCSVEELASWVFDGYWGLLMSDSVPSE